MWQYFVKDAPAFIKQNINTNLGLANGTEATQHSLTFCDDHQSKQLEEILSGPNPPPYGTEIELDAPPYSVNLEIKFSKEESFLSHVQKQQRLLLKNTLSLTQTFGSHPCHKKFRGKKRPQGILLIANFTKQTIIPCKYSSLLSNYIGLCCYSQLVTGTNNFKSSCFSFLSPFHTIYITFQILLILCGIVKSTKSK
jgi:hypothetical protein